MMRLLIVHSTNNIISGAEFAIEDMLAELPNDFCVEMQTPGEGRLAEYYRKKGFVVHVKKFSGPRKKYPGFFLIHTLFYAIWLAKNEYDIVLCNTFAASFRVSLACKLSRIKLVIYTREYFSKVKKVNFEQIKRANTIFAVSKDVKDYFAGLHPKVVVCHDTINIEKIINRINEHKLNLLRKEYFNIGFVGRITSYKQPDLFIKAIPIVLKKIPNAFFHVVGEANGREKSLEKSLQDLVDDIGISDKVMFWGRRNDSIEILSELDIFCLTSDREPFPRTIIEAMLCKASVVCSNTGGCLELIKDNETGLYFDVLSTSNSSSLAERVIQLYENKNKKAQIEENAYNSVCSMFGGKNQVKYFFEKIREV